MAATAHICIRPLRQDEAGPDEIGLLGPVLGGMSARGGHPNDHCPRPCVTERMRRELSGVDASRLVALVAEAIDAGGAATVGVGRMIAISDDVVDVAFAVVDTWHRRGVGRRLLRALRNRAMDLGYRVVVARVTADDRAAMGVLFSVFPGATMRRAGAAYDVVAALPEPMGAPALPLAV